MSVQLIIMSVQLRIMRLQLRIMSVQLRIARLQLGIMRLQLGIVRSERPQFRPWSFRKLGIFPKKKCISTTIIIYHGTPIKSARHSSSSSSSVSPSPYLTPNRGFVPLLYVHAVGFVSRLNP